LDNKSNNSPHANIVGNLILKRGGLLADWHEKRVLITGAGGFVGSYLARNLLGKGTSVYGLVRDHTDSGSPAEESGSGKSRMVRITGDLEDIRSLDRAMEISTPDIVFHLAAQSYVPRSFSDPLETTRINCIGTNNLLESVRKGECDPVVVFAGSSEEYGLVFSSHLQYEQLKKQYGVIFPEPSIPEVPIRETNPLRPMSPYAVSKVFGDHLTRNYYHTYGLKTVVSRAFNHEGAGRGLMFVTSVITQQVARFVSGGIQALSIGNVNAFRDWSHIDDIVMGYGILAEKGNYGDVYNQGTMRTTSVLSYLLMSLEASGYRVSSVTTSNGDKKVDSPTVPDDSPMYGTHFRKTRVDQMLLSGLLEYHPGDRGLIITTSKGNVPVLFDPVRFRPAEVPILLADTTKIQDIGYNPLYTVEDIIRDQLEYFGKMNGPCP
jgi:GDP-mannose 4,6-dehydratase